MIQLDRQFVGRPLERKAQALPRQAPLPVAAPVPGRAKVEPQDVKSALAGLLDELARLEAQLAQLKAQKVEEAPRAEHTYTVQPGDSLWAIAERELGDGNRWPEIYELNKDVVGGNPDLIHPGQTFKLPGGAEAPAPAPEKPAAPVADVPAGDGGTIVGEARKLMDSGYVYPPDLGANYRHERFKVGCCADFAVDSWAKAGHDVTGKVENPHYVPSLMQYFKGTGQFVPPDGRAQVGDMVFFRWPGDGDIGSHVAIVTEVDGNGKPTKIIESSNFNQPVRERAIGNSAGSIVGYAHP